MAQSAKSRVFRGAHARAGLAALVEIAPGHR
jgi:hypothetical protein